MTLIDINQAHVDAIQQNGLRGTLDCQDRWIPLNAQTPDKFNDDCDLLIFLTKTFQTRDALRPLAKILGSARVLSVQNGLTNEDVLLELFPHDRLILGIQLTRAEFVTPNHVRSTGNVCCKVFTANGAHAPMSDQLQAYARIAGLDLTLEPDIRTTI